MTLRLLTVALAALCLASCWGGGDGAEPRRAPAAPAEGSAGVDQGDLRVVRRWADTLRRGDVAGASELFALPAVVANGFSPVRVKTRAQVRLFNRALPCGAMVIDAEAAPHGFLIVTFRLTERPGRGACGQGTGGTARTAFRVRDGLITDWMRMPDTPERESDAQAA